VDSEYYALRPIFHRYPQKTEVEAEKYNEVDNNSTTTTAAVPFKDLPSSGIFAL